MRANVDLAPAARLLVATHNRGKLQEFRTLLGGAPFDLVSLPDLGVTGDVEETGSTLEENAALKARTYASMTGVATLADDSGLEVDALGGEPGVRSSRYAGDNATDAQRIDFLLSRLGDIPEDRWTARFRCVLAIAWPHDAPEYDMEYHVGECRGPDSKGAARLRGLRVRPRVPPAVAREDDGRAVRRGEERGEPSRGRGPQGRGCPEAPDRL